MTRATADHVGLTHHAGVAGLRVAVVTRDQAMRLEAARAFDDAPPSWVVTLHDSVPGDADVVVFGPDLGRAPGIVFDPLDPGGVVRAIKARVESDRSGSSVVVTSASGGTGVTTLALHLAAAAAQSSNTCVLEAEALSGAALRLGLEEGSYRTWAEVDGDGSILEGAVPMPGGFRALLAPPTWKRDLFGDVAAAAQRVFDTLIVDAPFCCPWPLFPEDAFTGVVVMSPTVPSAHRTRSLLDGHPDTSWAIVSNRLGPGGETTRTELEGTLERRIAVELPCTPALRDAEDEGRLLSTGWTRYWRAVVRLSKALRVP